MLLTDDQWSHIFVTTGQLSVCLDFLLRSDVMELIALTTFLTFVNITGVVAATQYLDEFQVEPQGIVIVEEIAQTNEPGSLLEAIQLKMSESR